MNGADGQIVEIRPLEDMVIVRTGNDVCNYNCLLGGIRFWVRKTVIALNQRGDSNNKRHALDIANGA